MENHEIVGVWHGNSTREDGPGPYDPLPILFEIRDDGTYYITVLGGSRSHTFGRWKRKGKNKWLARSIYMIRPDEQDGDYLALGGISLSIDKTGMLQGKFKRLSKPFRAGERPSEEMVMIKGRIEAIKIDLDPESPFP